MSTMPMVYFQDPQTAYNNNQAFAYTQMPANQVAQLPMGYGYQQPQFQWQPQGSRFGNYASLGMSLGIPILQMIGQGVAQNQQQDSVKQQQDHELAVVKENNATQLKLMEMQLEIARLNAGVLPAPPQPAAPTVRGEY